MPRTAVPKTVLLGPHPSLPVAALALDIPFTVADTVNFNQIALTGKLFLLVHNTGGGAGTFTLESAPDALGRSGDITTYSLGAGLLAGFMLTSTAGWKQTTGQFHLRASAATMKFAAIVIP